MIFRLGFLLTLFLYFSTALANFSIGPWKPIPHGKARFVEMSDHLEKGENYFLELQLETKWHSYWLNPGDSGAPPEIYSSLSGVQQKLDITYPFPEKIYVDPIMTYGYEDSAIYFFKAPKEFLSLSADLLICKEICIPGSITSERLELQKTDSLDETSKSLFDRSIKKLPVDSELSASYTKGLDQTRWDLSLPKNQKLKEIFWFPEQVESLAGENIIRQGDGIFQFFSKDRFSDNSPKMALITVQKESGLQAEVVRFIEKAPNLLPFFLFAILGGFILNLMPCVFPIVSLKAFSILKESENSQFQTRLNQFSYSLGVILSFLALAFLLVSLRASGSFVGWGFQLQDIRFVGFLAILFFLMALNFFDLWSINKIPGFATVRINDSGAGGSFLTGLLAVIVASPCTAPFMGAAIGFALSQSTNAILLIFTGLGLGMSLPFILFGFFPRLASFLPKPGVWMLWFKKLMALMLLATSIWLGWIASQILSVQNTSLGNHWVDFKVENWSQLNDSSQARFVNFTADWCVTCKVNEKLVFSSEKVQNYFKNRNFRTLKVDWTKRDSSTGKKISEFGRAGIPLYLYYPKGSNQVQILPELLSTDGLIEILENNKQGENK